MTEDHGEIKIRYSFEQGKRDALSSETVNVFPVSRWKIFLFLVPTFFPFSNFICFFLCYILRDFSWSLDLVVASETA
jgi:hypothetical protein